MHKISNVLKRLKYNYIAIKYLLNVEKNSKTGISLYQKLWCLFHGFSSAKYNLYLFKENNHRLYLSDFKRRKTAKINGPYSLIIDDKNLFTKVFSTDDITAKIYGKVKNGQIFLDRLKSSLEVLCNLIKNQETIIIKKFQGGGGKDIYRVSYNNDTLYLNDSRITWKDLNKFISTLSNHLIMEHLTQATYSNAIYSGTINSIRIITMRDPDTDEIFIPIAIHKFGSEKTKPVDNVSKGGITAQINLETGILGKSAYHYDNNNKIEWRDTHPDTGTIIEGTMIPGWEYVKKKVLEIANIEENLKYVGWDIVVTKNGIKLIEGNNYSDVNILQIHHPLLADERVKRFYEYYGIL